MGNDLPDSILATTKVLKMSLVNIQFSKKISKR